MRESKSARFCRLAEARVNKIIKMIRLLGNCSGKAVYQYDSEQVEEIFAAIQFELDAARRRFYTEKRRFSLSKPCDLHQDILANPHIRLSLPDGSKLTATAIQQDNYPSINIYLERQQKGPELICFAEHNPERDPGHTICVAAYQSDKDEPNYYARYRSERSCSDE